jgi:glucose/arabinose dehydrogenase
LRVRISPGNILEVESVFEYQFGRLRDVVQGPDGYLYFVEDHPTEAKLLRAIRE